MGLLLKTNDFKKFKFLAAHIWCYYDGQCSDQIFLNNANIFQLASADLHPEIHHEAAQADQEDRAYDDRLAAAVQSQHSREETRRTINLS